MAPAAATVLSPIEVADGVYVLPAQDAEIAPENLGRVANVAFVVGPRGAVVIDSGVSFRHGEAIIAAVGRVTSLPIRLVIITHPSQEAVFGAAGFQAHRIPVLMHRGSALLMAERCATCLRNLIGALGTAAMAGSRVVKPDRLVTGTLSLDPIGRPLLLLAPREGSAPGALAVYDPASRTLIAGSLVSIDSVPDLRDAGGQPWRSALVTLGATRCLHLIPARGRVGDCSDIDALDRYFATLDGKVRELLEAGVGLAELPSRCALPQYAAWGRYEALHARNASLAYLRLERASFGD